MPSIGFREQIKDLGLDTTIELWKSTIETLKDMIGSYSG